MQDVIVIPVPLRNKIEEDYLISVACIISDAGSGWCHGQCGSNLVQGQHELLRTLKQKKDLIQGAGDIPRLIIQGKDPPGRWGAGLCVPKTARKKVRRLA